MSIEKYYEDEVATVYHGDIADLISKLKYDIIITDPPYNIGYKYPDYDDNMFEEDYIEMLSCMQAQPTVIIHYPEAICNYVYSALGPVKKIINWCYHNNCSYRAHRTIAFFGCTPDFKRVRQPYKDPKDKRNIKLMENGSTGARMNDWFSDIQIIKNSSKEKCSDFTNQIPIALLERIILMTTNEGDVILDPFFGSGSLYFACKKTNRKCIGIDISKTHLECFKKRISQK